MFFFFIFNLLTILDPFLLVFHKVEGDVTVTLLDDGERIIQIRADVETSPRGKKILFFEVAIATRARAVARKAKEIRLGAEVIQIPGCVAAEMIDAITWKNLNLPDAGLADELMVDDRIRSGVGIAGDLIGRRSENFIRPRINGGSGVGNIIGVVPNLGN
jgi:hypothetical protein